MESLALMVALLLGWLLLAGPVGVLLSRSVLAPLGITFGVLSAISGTAYLIGVPGTVRPLAIWAILSGVVAIHLGVLRYTAGKAGEQ